MTVLVRKRAILFVSFLFVQGKSTFNTFTFPRGRTTSTKWWTIVWFIAEWYRCHFFVMTHVSQSILVQFSGWSYMIGISSFEIPFIWVWSRSASSIGYSPAKPPLEQQPKLLCYECCIWSIVLSSHFWDYFINRSYKDPVMNQSGLHGSCVFHVAHFSEPTPYP